MTGYRRRCSPQDISMGIQIYRCAKWQSVREIVSAKFKSGRGGGSVTGSLSYEADLDVMFMPQKPSSRKLQELIKTRSGRSRVRRS
ncbi:hypothetical protein OS493_028200 [Desmophyllum pertusum]|uniref:Uncharacterized protein n=1 Tax=Desmophyllum pertusum TaxID=174260 RepID=A0A9X0CR00_9CNID|nr:hypothetical protein OS493_028200 [Desmophyllum pertusum]